MLDTAELVVITGSVVSVTFTVLVTSEAALPEASVTEYVIVYSPNIDVVTVPELVTVSPLSAVAPASVYVLPSSTVAGLSPLRLITGSVVSVTFTVLVTSEAALPEASVTEYVIVYSPNIDVVTVPELVTVSPLSAVAPASVYVLPSSTVAGLSPLRLITGSVVSVTFTVLVTSEAALPEASVTEYVIVYSPNIDVVTVPELVTVSPLSAVAPASVYVLPSSTVAGLSPLRLITGSVVSVTFTVLVTSEAALPEASVTEYVIVYSPNIDVVTVPELVTVSPLSAVAPASVYVLPSSTVAGLSPLRLITGSVVSVTFTVLVTSEAALPEASVTEYVIVYSPNIDVVTVPELVTVSPLSAVAPASVYVLPSSTVAGLSPLRLITGSVVSVTFTVLVTSEAALPEASVTEYVIVYSPNIDVVTVPELVTVSPLSAVAPASVYVLPSSTVAGLSPLRLITGSVVSVTFTVLVTSEAALPEASVTEYVIVYSPNIDVVTVPELVTVSPLSAVAPASVYVLPSSTVAGLSPLRLITGSVVSVTFTVLVTSEAALPEASVTEYVIVYSPNIDVVTVPELVTVSPLSAVAPASVYVLPSSTVAGLSPLRLITGSVVSVTFTVLVTSEAALPEASVTEYVIVYSPNIDVVTVPELVTVSPLSAVAPASVYVLPSSTVAGLSPLRLITGSVVSVTFTVLVTSEAALPEASVTEYVIVYSPNIDVVTVPELVTVSPLSAVAPASVYVLPSSTVAGLSPLRLITGSVVSVTFTVLVTSEAALPEASVTEYVIVYSPNIDVVTVPELVTVSPLSAVAPASVYVLPSSTVAGLSPLRVITGGISSTSVIENVTVVAALVLPAASEAVTVKL